jgi:hypothetical protein
MKRRKCATFCMYPCLATFFSSERRTGRLQYVENWPGQNLAGLYNIWRRWMLQMIYRKSCPWRSTRASFSVALNAQFTVHCKENPISVFLSENCAASVPISTVLCLWAIYSIYSKDWSTYCISLQQNRQTWKYKNLSQIYMSLGDRTL